MRSNLNSISNNRLLGLDGVRGIACLAVMLWHFCFWYGEMWGHSSAPVLSAYYGNFGVQAFFILSGFVILLTLDRTHTTRQFLISRLGRLFPPYWAAVLLLFPITAIVRMSPPVPVHDTVTLTELVFNLTMIPTVLGARYVDSAHWSLGFELVFYSWIAIAFLFGCRQPRTFVFVFVAWTTAAVIWAQYIHACGIETWKTIFWHDDMNDWRFVAAKLLLFPYVNLFLIGIASYTLWKKCHFFAGCIGFMVGIVADFMIWGVEHGFCVLLVALAFLAVIRFDPRFLKARPIVILGEISFSLYLIHQDVGFRVIQQLERQGASANFAILAAVVVCVFVASCFHYCIELPAHGFFKSLAKRQSNPPVDEPAHTGLRKTS